MQVNKFESEEGIAIFRLKGKLIASMLDNLKASMDNALTDDTPAMIINLKDTQALDGYMAGLLASRAKTFIRKGGVAGFCNVSPAMRCLLEQSESQVIIYGAEKEGVSQIVQKIKAGDQSA